MESKLQKLKRNIKQGTFWKNVPIALKNRFFKEIKTTNLIYFLDNKRILTKKYERSINKLKTNYIRAGNYYLDSRVPITEKSIVYSLGVLSEISFDIFLQEEFGCEIFMYDPTPVSITFMEKYKLNERLNYEAIGVWTENTTLKFYEPRYGGSASVMEEQKTNKHFSAECLTVETLMRKNNHNKISVFKADIEGAALPILKQMTAQNIFPDQIVVEFERPKSNISKVNAFFKDLSDLRSKLEESGYEEYLLPRKKAKYFSLEMLFVKKNKIQ